MRSCIKFVLVFSLFFYGFVFSAEALPAAPNKVVLKPEKIYTNLFYARAGIGYFFDMESTAGFSFGFGVRHPIDNFVVDLSFLNVSYTKSTSTTRKGGLVDGEPYIYDQKFEKGYDLGLAKISALYYFNHGGASSCYAGAGLSAGRTKYYLNVEAEYAFFLRGELSAGFEFARTSDVTFFVQADAVFPFSTTNIYLEHRDVFVKKYVPFLILSLGMGF